MQYKVSRNYSGLTIEEYLMEFHLGKAKRHTFLSNALIAGKSIAANYILQENDIIEVDLPEKNDLQPFAHKLNVIYEDEYLLIVDKYPLIKTHTNESFEVESMANMVSHYYQEKNIKLKVKYVHRLDLETSGILVFAKDMLTEAYFNHHFTMHDFKREYLALVEGIFTQKQGQVEIGIGEDRHHSKRRIATKKGDYAKTFYEVLDSSNQISLVKLTLATGRQHQIRVHMAYLQHPLLGDTIYGSNFKAKRVMLHSWRFTFYHPFKEKYFTVKARIPNDFKEIMSKYDLGEKNEKESYFNK